MANDLVVSKQQIASYVHDATDVEKRIFTLEQVAEELEKNAESNRIRGDCYSAVAQNEKFWEEVKDLEEDTGYYRHRRDVRDVFNDVEPLAGIVSPDDYDDEDYDRVDIVGLIKRETKDKICGDFKVSKLNLKSVDEYYYTDSIKNLYRRKKQPYNENDRAFLEKWNFANRGRFKKLFITCWIICSILFGVCVSASEDFVLLFLIGGIIEMGLMGVAIAGIIYGMTNGSKRNAYLQTINGEIYSNNQRVEDEIEKLAKEKTLKKQEIEDWNNNERNRVNGEAEKKRQDLLSISEKAYNQAEFYASQAAETRKSLEPLYEQRNKFYSVGIVPPDYRTMDCAYAFDQIFRNDLADNMREAVKIYEERVFRGEIIRGVRSLEAFMGKVSSLLTTLQADMSSIKTQVGLMNKDIVRIYEQQEIQNTAMIDDMKRNYAAIESRNRELFKETQMSRYALESIRESNDKIIKYIED